MAYVERWNTSWNTLKQVTTYSLKILEDGYAGGTTAIENLATEPVQIRNRGIDIETIGAVIGTEIQFSFMVEPADGTEYDDLFAAVERQFKIEVYKGANLYFVGFMNPSNMSRPLITRTYMVTLSAADGLAELKNETFRDSGGNLYGDRVEFMTILKRCLEKTDHALDLNIHCNIHEDTYQDNLKTGYRGKSDCKRFFRTVDGIVTSDTCHAVLAECIGLFNCSIRQLNGKWHIWNNQEISSKMFEIFWADLTEDDFQNYDPSIAIDAYEMKSRGDIAYRPPLSDVAITFQNKFVPTSLVNNGDFSNGITNWDNGTGNNAFSTFQAGTGDTLQADLAGTLTYDVEFSQDAISVTKVAASDTFALTLRAKCVAYTHAIPEEDEPPFLMALVSSASGSQVLDMGQMSMDWKQHVHYIEPVLFQASGAENYTIKIYIEADNNWSALELLFDDIELTIDYGAAAVTTDKIITIHNDNAVDTLKQEHSTRVGDSLSLNDEGAITIGIGNSLTAKWNSYGGSEAINLIDLLGAFQLNQRSTFVKYLRLVINDESDNLDSGKILLFDSVYYRIIRYKKMLRSLTVEVDLIEINT